MPVVRKVTRRVIVKFEQSELYMCRICTGLYASSAERTTCGDPDCQREYVGRLTRDRYRAKVGIPVDPDEPTLFWTRLHGLPRAPYRRAA